MTKGRGREGVLGGSCSRQGPRPKVTTKHNTMNTQQYEPMIHPITGWFIKMKRIHPERRVRRKPKKP